MKINLITYSMYGAWFTLRLNEEGHDVTTHYIGKASDPSQYALYDIIKPIVKGEPTEAELQKSDLAIFDLTGKPKLAERFTEFCPVLGDGNINTQIEDDRLLGIQVMEESDINVPSYEAFNDLGEAKRFIRKTDKRYVFKPNGGQEQDTASTFVSKSAEDMLRYLDKLGAAAKGVEFVLQEVVEGTEVSTEAWFDGTDFHLINGTLEEKKFMNDNRGPNTGCAGNLVWAYDNLNPPYIFREGLGKLKDFLQQYNYKGMIDLNTIVNDTELYGLEWTPRFGYDATATLFSLIRSNVGEFLCAVSAGAKPDYELNNTFAASVRVSIPPYPSEIKNEHPEGIPVNGIDEDEILSNLFMYDVVLDGDEFYTAGINGLVLAPIHTAQSISGAFAKVDERLKAIEIPNAQYRTDLECCTAKRYKILAEQGWLR